MVFEDVAAIATQAGILCCCKDSCRVWSIPAVVAPQMLGGCALRTSKALPNCLRLISGIPLSYHEWVSYRSMPSALETPEVKLGGPHGGGPRDHGPYDPGGGGGDDGNHGRGVPGAGLLAMRFLLVSITMLFVTIGVAYHQRAKSHVHWQHIH